MNRANHSSFRAMTISNILTSNIDVPMVKVTTGF
jgi:hypothetical protein